MAKTPSDGGTHLATKAGTPIAIQGRPRRDLTEGGVHVILYPTFKKWLARSKEHKATWDRLPDRRRYFVLLACTAFFPPDSKNVKTPLAYCYSVAPALTCAALLVLLKRTAKVTMEDYTAATSKPHYGDATQARKITTREADRRRKAHAALAEFMADTAPKAI
jgi:hypothetical protein